MKNGRQMCLESFPDSVTVKFIFRYFPSYPLIIIQSECCHICETNGYLKAIINFPKKI